MRYVTRSEQSAVQVGYSLLSKLPVHTDGLADDYYDGVPIAGKSPALHWIEEHDVHRAPWLSENIDSSSYFLGAQSLLCRDELRDVTHVAVPDRGVVLKTVRDGHVIEARRLSSEILRRAHVEVRKFDGKPFVLHISGNENGFRLYMNEDLIETASSNIDFPFLCFDQEGMGNIPEAAPSFGLLSYKDRSSGKVLVRAISPDGGIGEEVTLNSPPTVGGADFAICGGRGLLRINALVDGRIQPMLGTLERGTESELKFESISIENEKLKRFLPPNAPVFADHLGVLHVPLPTLIGEQFILLDYVPDHFVSEAIAKKFSPPMYEIMVPFPKKPAIIMDTLGVGDGLTDGVGIIASVSEEGKVLSSNSQSGGTLFPEPAFLNYDMPQVFALKATQCYTRFSEPNRVSMDYVFVEADSEGSPISSNLFLETWDMPLPAPKVTASADGRTISVKIERDGFFYPGGVQLSVSNPLIEIVSVEITGERSATVKYNGVLGSSDRLLLRSENQFYSHAGECLIEQP